MIDANILSKKLELAVPIQIDPALGAKLAATSNIIA